METQIENIAYVYRKIIKNTQYSIQANIVEFWDLLTIQEIYQQVKKNNNKQYFFQLISLQYLMLKFINKVDRSLFFLFYQQPQFIKIEKQLFMSIAATNATEFQKLPKIFDRLIDQIQIELKQIENFKEIVQCIEKLLFDSQLPLPKLKLETVAMYCQSPFQLFLAEIKFPEVGQQWLEPPLENLKEYITVNLKNYHKIFSQAITTQLHQFNIHEKILKVRYYGHDINSKNWKNYLIKGCLIHNIIVYLYALTDNIIHSYQKLIRLHNDPFMKFVQFCLRYSIYRNTILGIQENLKFLFENYHKLFKISFHKYNHKPNFRFWLPSMRRWLNTMKHHHYTLQHVYQYIVTQQRSKNLISFIQKQMQRLPSVYNPIYNQLQQGTFHLETNIELYHDIGRQIQGFFQENPDLYEVVAKDYLEYMIDISVNQYTVHWCGSTNQKFQPGAPFINFHKEFLVYNLTYYEYLSQIILQKCQGNLGLTVLKQIIQSDLDFLICKFIKPITGKQLLNRFLEKLRKIIQKQPQLQIFSQELLQQYSPKIDFYYKDNLLEYFNGKTKIDLSCPQSQSCFYQISTKQSFQSIIEKTLMKYQHSSDSNSQTDQQPYHSDIENQQQQNKGSSEQKLLKQEQQNNQQKKQEK